MNEYLDDLRKAYEKISAGREKQDLRQAWSEHGMDFLEECSQAVLPSGNLPLYAWDNLGMGTQVDFIVKALEMFWI